MKPEQMIADVEKAFLKRAAKFNALANRLTEEMERTNKLRVKAIEAIKAGKLTKADEFLADTYVDLLSYHDPEELLNAYLYIPARTLEALEEEETVKRFGKTIKCKLCGNEYRKK